MGTPPYIINGISTSLALLCLHVFNSWPTLIDDLMLELSGSIDHCVCLLQILTYFASDCDNDDIVIEESIRKQFYNFIDQMAPTIFSKIFNDLAHKIQAGLI